MQGERAVQRPSNASFPLSSSRYYTNKPHDALLISRKDAKRTKRKNSMCRLYYHYIFLCLSLSLARGRIRANGIIIISARVAREKERGERRGCHIVICKATPPLSLRALFCASVQLISRLSLLPIILAKDNGALYAS